jgi:hypothetical protein
MKFASLLTPSIVSAACILLAATSTARANGTIYLETGPQYGQSNPYQYGNGGEFTAITTGLTVQLTPGTQAPAGYASDATFTVNGVTGFETFCIEDQVDFYVGGTYNYSIGTPPNAVLQQGSAGIQQLTAGAAWLYEQFSTGQLAGYDYTNQANRLADAGILQATLWALQDEPADGSVPYIPDPHSNFALADLIANPNFGSFAAAQAIADTSYGVSVLELTDGNGNAAQDQLIYWGPHVPDNGTTALLIGGSLLVMAGFSRRFRAVASK